MLQLREWYMGIKKNKEEKGQSLVELIFSVGIIVLVLTGVVVLVSNVLGARTKALTRKKATELATLVVEDLVNKSKNSPDIFWTLTNEAGVTNPDFPGYNYSIDFTNISVGQSGYPNCGIGETNCAEAVVSVGWSGKTPESVMFNRFFFKQ